MLARLLTERNLLGTKIGTLALTCAAVDDIIAWCLLALVIAVVHARGVASALFTVGLTILFIGLMLVVVRPLLLLASATTAIGIHPVFGAFLMGIILPRTTLFIEQVRSIDRTISLLFLPLYFVFTGLRTHIGLISGPALWLICLLVLVLACAGKIFGGTFSLRLLGESWREALSLGVLMNTRGLVELIVLNIGLDLGVLSPTLFSMLVIMAIVTTMMASPLLALLGYRSKGPQEIAYATDEDVQEQAQPG